MRGSDHGVVPGSGSGSLPPSLTASILLLLPGPGFALARSVQLCLVHRLLPSGSGWSASCLKSTRCFTSLEE